MRLLCGAWLVPAASLIWIGLASTGARHASEQSQVLALGRTQATAIVLALLTVLVGASVFVRQSTGPISPATDRNDTGSSQAGLRPRCCWSHGVAAALMLIAAVVGSGVDAAAPVLLPTAAICGLWAALVLPRALIRHPGSWSSPLAALAAGISFQLTVGWLHLANPDAALSPVLVIEGLLLAWVAASAARVDPFAIPVTAVEAAPVDLATSVVSVPPVAQVTPVTARPKAASNPGGFSRASAPPSIPEAAVGR